MAAIQTQGEDIPKAITMTDYHYVLLFERRVVGISRITERVVWEEMIPMVSCSSLLHRGPVT
jgi:hypothetical protein